MQKDLILMSFQRILHPPRNPRFRTPRITNFVRIRRIHGKDINIKASTKKTYSMKKNQMQKSSPRIPRTPRFKTQSAHSKMQTINEIQTTTKYSCKIMSNVVSLFIKKTVRNLPSFIDVNFIRRLYNGRKNAVSTHKHT